MTMGWPSAVPAASATMRPTMSFDPHKVIDRATFEEPKQESEGIEEVWTNGVPTYRAASGLTGECPGRLIRRHRA